MSRLCPPLAACGCRSGNSDRGSTRCRRSATRCSSSFPLAIPFTASGYPTVCGSVILGLGNRDPGGSIGRNGGIPSTPLGAGRRFRGPLAPADSKRQSLLTQARWPATEFCQSNSLRSPILPISPEFLRSADSGFFSHKAYFLWPGSFSATVGEDKSRIPRPCRRHSKEFRGIRTSQSVKTSRFPGLTGTEFRPESLGFAEESSPACGTGIERSCSHSNIRCRQRRSGVNEIVSHDARVGFRCTSE